MVIGVTLFDMTTLNSHLFVDTIALASLSWFLLCPYCNTHHPALEISSSFFTLFPCIPLFLSHLWYVFGPNEHDYKSVYMHE